MFRFDPAPLTSSLPTNIPPLHPWSITGRHNCAICWKVTPRSTCTQTSLWKALMTQKNQLFLYFRHSNTTYRVSRMKAPPPTKSDNTQCLREALRKEDCCTHGVSTTVYKWFYRTPFRSASGRHWILSDFVGGGGFIRDTPAYQFILEKTTHSVIGSCWYEVHIQQAPRTDRFRPRWWLWSIPVLENILELYRAK